MESTEPVMSEHCLPPQPAGQLCTVLKGYVTLQSSVRNLVVYSLIVPFNNCTMGAVDRDMFPLLAPFGKGLAAPL